MGECGLDIAFMGQAQQFHRQAAGIAFRQPLHGGIVEIAIGIPGEELIAIAESGQSSRLLAQGMNDVTVVHDMLGGAELASDARQLHQGRAAEEQFDMLLEEPCAQPMSDQP
ncbi:hypothetical protein X751_30760 [Mesorhizobium sp. LNJC395A00]|nr:hypothetical protein X751_30760 [Mesorhizobium sp. LNJC395A00]